MNAITKVKASQVNNTEYMFLQHFAGSEVVWSGFKINGTFWMCEQKDIEQFIANVGLLD
jgi:hypothetical protein